VSELTAPFDDIARGADRLKALSLVLRECNRDKHALSGMGTVPCPTCGGSLQFTFTRLRTRRRQAVQVDARCTTPECLRFTSG
jgi:hypothetical protein